MSAGTKQPSISEYEIERHMQKQGVDRRDAERYFEAEGYRLPDDDLWEDPDWTEPVFTGPNTAAIAAQDLDVLVRERRLTGWAQAAELHGERLVDGVGSVCYECSHRSSPRWAEWPCLTAAALGLDQR